MAKFWNWIRVMLAPLVVLLALLINYSTPALAAELIMYEQAGCVWCKRFNEEIAPAWPKTEQGRRAPLRRVDIHGAIPPDLAGILVERFTPTFVLLDDGREVARLRGYPGDQFFWTLIDEMLAKLEP